TRDGRLLGRLPIGPEDRLAACVGWASPTAAAVAVVSDDPPDRVGAWLEEWLPWLGLRAAPGRVKVVDVATGRATCVVSGGTRSVHFAPDGGLVVHRPDAVQVWDVPPRTPLTWLAGAAALLALPPAGVAWWRTRRLRRRVV